MLLVEAADRSICLPCWSRPAIAATLHPSRSAPWQRHAGCPQANSPTTTHKLLLNATRLRLPKSHTKVPGIAGKERPGCAISRYRHARALPDVAQHHRSPDCGALSPIVLEPGPAARRAPHRFPDVSPTASYGDYISCRGHGSTRCPCRTKNVPAPLLPLHISQNPCATRRHAASRPLRRGTHRSKAPGQPQNTAAAPDQLSPHREMKPACIDPGPTSALRRRCFDASQRSGFNCNFLGSPRTPPVLHAAVPSCRAASESLASAPSPVPGRSP